MTFLWLLLILGVCQSNCGHDWLHQYSVSSKSENWHAARKICQQRHGDLTSIEDASENDYIKQILGGGENTAYWIGYTDQKQEGQFTWIDGERYGYVNWDAKEPNDAFSNEDCTVIRLSGKWNDDNCQTQFPFVCKTPRWRYEKSKTKKTWQSARDDCRGKEGDLLSILSSREQAFMETLLADDDALDYWIGLSDTREEGKFHWSDQAEKKYENWRQGEPNNHGGNEDCVVLSRPRNMKWNDEDCGKKFHYICKISTFKYKMSTVEKTWTDAEGECKVQGGHLVSIGSEEEKSYIIALLKAHDRLWIGFNDQSREDSFQWTDESKSKYKNWNANEPNNVNDNEDCTEWVTLKSGWNDIECSRKRRFLCKLPSVAIDECKTGIHSCHSDAKCKDTPESYQCRCKTGYAGDGFSCSDVNECRLPTTQCPMYSYCENTVGSYKCICYPGAKSLPDGTCQDINECEETPSVCSPSAICTNYPPLSFSDARFNCQCKKSHYGNGINCTACGKDIFYFEGKVSITSPNYSSRHHNYYPSDANDCTYNVEPKTYPMDMVIENCQVNREDKIIVYDGGREVLYSSWPRGTIVRIKNSAKVVFATDHQYNNRGFKINFYEGWRYFFCKCFKSHRRFESPVDCFLKDQNVIFSTRYADSSVNECFDTKHSKAPHCQQYRLFRVHQWFVEDLKQLKVGTDLRCRSNMRYDISNIFIYFHDDLQQIGCHDNTSVGFVTRLLSSIVSMDFASSIDMDGFNCYKSPKYYQILFSGYNAQNMIKEAHRLCEEKQNWRACQIMALVKVSRLIGELHGGKTAVSGEKFQMYSTAIKTNLILNFPNQREFARLGVKFIYKGSSPLGYSTIFLDNLQNLVNLVRTGDKKELSDYMHYASDYTINQAIQGCSREKKDWRCMTRNLYEQIHLYMKEVAKGTKQVNGRAPRKILRSEVDYSKLIQERESSETLRLIQEQTATLLTVTESLKKEFRKESSRRFYELKSYFNKIESYNAAKTKSDFVFIQSRLDLYKNYSEVLSRKVSEGIGTCLNYALAISGVDVVESFVHLTLALAQAGNPFKWVFNGNTITDILEKTADLADSVAAFSKASMLRIRWISLKDSVLQLAKKFRRNREFQLKVHQLIEHAKTEDTTSAKFKALQTDFLKKYDTYPAAVTKPELTATMTLWEEILEVACDLIANGKGTAANAIKAKVNVEGSCINTKVDIVKMIETYAEIYDFQFDLMEAFAAYMRALSALDASKGVASDFDLLTSTRTTANDAYVTNNLQFLSGYTYVIYIIHQWFNVKDYCNLLEYQEGGKMPPVCQQSKTNIPMLLAYVPRSCRQVTSGYVDIPTRPQFKGDKAYIDIASLYRGYGQYFQIPNMQWLVDHGWVNAVDKDSIIFARSFEIYLPSVSKSKKIVVIKVTLVGDSKYSMKGPLYVITPSNSLTLEYAEGGYIPCHRTPLENPYNLCPTNKLPGYCLLSQDYGDSRRLDPLLLSKWYVRLYGYSKEDLPKPVTDLPLKAKINYCKLSPSWRLKRNAQADAFHLKAASRMEKCCDWKKNEFWSKKKLKCLVCPAGSKSLLNGVYCAKQI